MDVNDVPQDALEYKDRNKITKVIYATNKDGKYTSTDSAGWEAENIAMKQAWDVIEDELAEAEKKVKDGTLSPVGYFMLKKLMDVQILARYVGKWQWQVKRHFKPSVFQSLSKATLEKYASVFEVTVDELVNFGKTK